MFCTSCNTAFDWKSGRTVDAPDRIHNPHYYEWLFRTRGAPGRDAAPAPGRDAPAPCGENAFMAHPMHVRDRELLGFHRVGRHLMYGELRWARTRIRALAAEPVKLRLQYLVGEIDAATWRTTLQRREKLREKTRAVADVYDTYVAAGGDVFTEFARTMGAAGAAGTGGYTAACEAARAQLRQLVEYTDGCLRGIADRFNMSVTTISSMMGDIL